ncbi:MAG: hypothetical protein OHK0013_35670 [Sandaracinaceae bacterium]
MPGSSVRVASASAATFDLGLLAERPLPRPTRPRRPSPKLADVRTHFFGLALATLAVLGLPAAAAAQVHTQRANDDGVYGRFGSDLVLSLGVNAGVSLGDPALAARASDAPTLAIDAELRARILDSAGVVIAPQWRPDGASRLIAALDIRPVFLARFLLGASTGDRYVDLFFDSLGVELGATVFAPDGRVAVAFAVGFGAEIPLWAPPETTGAVAIRLGARWTGAGSADVWGPQRAVDDWTIHAGILVRFHANVGLARWEPDRYRVR